MTFAEWVESEGGRAAVAERLGVTKEALHHWIHRKAVPRWKTIQKIVKMSNGKLTAIRIIYDTVKESRR